jgi:hypothetical protein
MAISLRLLAGIRVQIEAASFGEFAWRFNPKSPCPDLVRLGPGIHETVLWHAWTVRET